jgi:hypothetical protein
LKFPGQAAAHHRTHRHHATSSMLNPKIPAFPRLVVYIVGIFPDNLNNRKVSFVVLRLRTTFSAGHRELFVFPFCWVDA